MAITWKEQISIAKLSVSGCWMRRVVVLLVSILMSSLLVWDLKKHLG
jgi:hypothetical protein